MRKVSRRHHSARARGRLSASGTPLARDARTSRAGRASDPRAAPRVSPGRGERWREFVKSNARGGANPSALRWWAKCRRVGTLGCEPQGARENQAAPLSLGAAITGSPLHSFSRCVTRVRTRRAESMTAIVRRASWSKHALTLFLASACSVCGCSDRPSFGSTDMGTRYPDDAWIRRQPPPMSSVDANLPQSQFCEAGELEQEAALARLATSPFVALTPDELRVYSRGKLALHAVGAARGRRDPAGSAARSVRPAHGRVLTARRPPSQVASDRGRAHLVLGG